MLLVLQRVYFTKALVQDYCGLLSEEAVRKNFVLLYELLDEVVDYGFPQNSSSEALKEFVLNEATVVKPSVSNSYATLHSFSSAMHPELRCCEMQRIKGSNLFPGAAKGPTGVIKSVLDTSRTDGGRRDEIFVDVVEKVSCTFNASGYIQTSQIDGAIQVFFYFPLP